jgi:hypothetical protein
MAKKPAESATETKTRKLRELREADEAKRRADGTWGTLSVAEIVHPASNAVFVLRTRGRDAPDPAKEVKTRSALVSGEDHKALVAWVGQRGIAEFQARLVGWNLSEQEAKRMWHARIEENRARGVTVVNAATAPAAAA